MFAYTDYLPPFLREVRELRAIGAAVDVQASELCTQAVQLAENQFIGAAGLTILTRWEHILGLVYNPVFTLEERRQQILSRLQMQSVVTLEKLTDMLDRLTNGDTMVTMDYARCLLTIRVALTSKYSFNNVANLLHDVVPANIVIDLSLLYNSHAVLSQFTHAQLAERTHKQLREDVLND